ncbi:MAG TPA: radical SAM protein, partial [Bacilli bacterium]|nr:radical SAM protein [Bacilli bacterium]
MKVLLVGINSKYIHPAMGIIQLAANTTWPVTLREFTIKDDPQRIAKEISDFHADVVGISVYIWNATLVKTILSQLSQQLTIVVGGPEASYRPAEYFAFSNVDYLVKDEGEQAFHYLLNYLNGLMPLDEVPNLYYRGEEIKFTFNALPDITTIKHDYSLMGNLKHRYLYLESSRGCPYACSYCLASLEKKVRFFPLSQIKKEILWAFHIKTPTVKFLDRTFNCDSQRMIEILSFIQEHDTKQTVFQFEVVADILNEETVRFLKQLRPGLVRFEIGIQSANETTMEAISRKQNFSQIQTIVQQLKPTITIHLDLIAGLPYEDKPSFINTFNQTLLMFPDELQLGILKALAGTKIV